MPVRVTSQRHAGDDFDDEEWDEDEDWDEGDEEEDDEEPDGDEETWQVGEPRGAHR